MISKFFFPLLILSSGGSFFKSEGHVDTIFLHGAYAHPGQAKRFQDAFPGDLKKVTSVLNKPVAPKFLDSQKETSWNPLSMAIAFVAKQKLHVDFAPSYAYFGSGKDVDTVHESIAKNTLKDNKIVMFGCCRGGMAGIKYLAQHDPNAHSIDALVVEGTPADPTTAFNKKLGQLGMPIALSKQVFKTLWPAYVTREASPFESIEKIENKKLPTLLIHSENDATFPFVENGLKLYSEFKKRGFENVYIAPVKGQHAWSLRDDKELYLQAVHSFYKEHSLPHNQSYATKSMKNYLYDLDTASSMIKAGQDDLDALIRRRQIQLLSAAVVGGGLCYAWKKYQKNNPKKAESSKLSVDVNAAKLFV